MLISTSDDAHFKIWDVRTQKATLAYKAAEESLCVGAFNPLFEHLFAVAGDSSGEIQVWDLRMPQECINSLQHHTKQVTSLEWCPSRQYLLASGSDDNRVYVWDQAEAGQE